MDGTVKLSIEDYEDLLGYKDKYKELYKNSKKIIIIEQRDLYGNFNNIKIFENNLYDELFKRIPLINSCVIDTDTYNNIQKKIVKIERIKSCFVGYDLIRSFKNKKEILKQLQKIFNDIIIILEEKD